MKTSKIKTIFRCQSCGYASSKWLGKCSDCGEWNTFVEEKEVPPLASVGRRGALTDFSSKVVALDKVSSENFIRTPSDIAEFDRILGGGVVKGSLILLGGPPGIGKSTLMLQACGALSKSAKVLYVSGEESLAQVKNRADRLGIKSSNLLLVSETNLENIIDALKKNLPEIVVIDSIQTTFRNDMTGAPGSVGQIRECTAEFLRAAKSKNITFFLLGHVTKEGDLAGPRVLEHIVDTVLYFETERQQIYRILRSYKNRFGPTSEIGVFEMTGNGLMEVKNPSLMFLGERHSQVPGNVVVPTMEGTRPLMLEIQALVARSNFGFPKRMVTGYDANRLTLIIAVLEKRAGLRLEASDVFVNVAGGIKIKETGADLGIACSIASAYNGFIPDATSVLIGEVGLGGEVRSVGHIPARLIEAEKLGFLRAIIPQSNMKNLSYSGKLKVIPVDTIEQAIKAIKQ
ncbi:MAG: DNA repair protein RadA [Endomicrobiales bacterium]|nr:DNA repair protein RadA [Endomicrobiales bacterium]